jgi:predicted RND superfamily exporter protein
MSREYIEGLFRGVSISLGVSLIVLLIATGNFIVSLLAFVSLVGIVFCTLGCMWIYGWSIGIIESICAVLSVGFAIDFTVHLGISYVERKPDMTSYNLGSSRHDRVTHAFLELGTSVLGGGMTTLGASLFLFACVINIFTIFGIFMCTAVLWSLFHSHFFFMPCLCVAGPVGSFGDVGLTCMYKRWKAAKTTAVVPAQPD